jgi:hypothetical protein
MADLFLLGTTELGCGYEHPPGGLQPDLNAIAAAGRAGGTA